MNFDVRLAIYRICTDFWLQNQTLFRDFSKMLISFYRLKSSIFFSILLSTEISELIENPRSTDACRSEKNRSFLVKSHKSAHSVTLVMLS